MDGWKKIEVVAIVERISCLFVQSINHTTTNKNQFNEKKEMHAMEWTS
jgi:hypothetical protein